MNIKKILKISEWVIFIVLMLILFVAASPLLPTKHLLSIYTVSTGSMEPTIPTGSLAISTSSSTLSSNDIIAFKSPTDPDITVIHRIVEIEEDKYITKGDNNESQDAWSVEKGDVIGKVSLVIPYVGKAIEWIKTPVGFISILVLPALVFSVSQIRKIKEGVDEEIERRTEIALEEAKHKKKKSVPIPLMIILPILLLLSLSSEIKAYFSSKVSSNPFTISIAGDAEAPTDINPEEVE